MVRQKSEPNKIDGRKRDSIGETRRDERNDEDEGKLVVPVQQHDVAQDEDVGFEKILYFLLSSVSIFWLSGTFTVSC